MDEEIEDKTFLRRLDPQLFGFDHAIAGPMRPESGEDGRSFLRNNEVAVERGSFD
jgi:hypothetical protein